MLLLHRQCRVWSILNALNPLYLDHCPRNCNRRPKQNKQYKELLQLLPEPSNPVTPPSHPLEISSPLTLPGSDLHRSTSDSDNTATDSSSHLCPISLPTQPTFSKPSFVHKPHTIPSPFLNESSYQFSKSLTSYFHTTFTLKQDLNLNPIGLSEAKPNIQMSPSTTSANDVNAKEKSLSETTKYKSTVEVLLANGSNFNKWHRNLNWVIHLCLDHIVELI